MSDRCFELALVMAGAVSGGAYQGGAMDFLVRALDAWDKARGDGASPVPGVPLPDHRVMLSGFAGTSAGSYTAAIASVALRYDFPTVADPGTEPATKSANPFFEAWVNRVHIAGLLRDRDLVKGAPLPSLLDCTDIDATVDTLLDMQPPVRTRSWVAEHLALRMTLGNLRGVPYGLALGHGSGVTHQMTLHADTADFVLAGRGSAAGRNHAGYTALPAGNSAATWQALGQAAKASAAFPFALRPRLITRPTSDYASRTWVDDGDGGSFLRCARTIAPLPGMPAQYSFMAMDGGIMNNEPLELGRALLLDSPEDFNLRSGKAATKAVVMIDPFVDPANIEDAAAPSSLVRLIMPLLNAWKAQCRFKPEDLAMAGAENIYSRFAIAPRRTPPPRPADADGDALPNPLASGGLGAFLGFFDRRFRVHDFQLGQRNTQRFLTRSLALPVENPVVAPWWTGLDQTQRQSAIAAGWAFEEDGTVYVPLIPLMPDIAAEIPEPQWPTAPAAESFRDALGFRFDRVVTAFLAESGAGFVLRTLLGGVWRFGVRGRLLDGAVTAIAHAFKKQWFR